MGFIIPPMVIHNAENTDKIREIINQLPNTDRLEEPEKIFEEVKRQLIEIGEPDVIPFLRG